MSRLFLGKISKKYPIQFTENFYAAGKPDSKWYGGIQPGDYVFPIYNARVEKLWRVKGYSDKPNPINSEGIVEFETIKSFAPIPVANVFLRQKYFELDLNTVNKSVKSAESGFFEITLMPGSPDIESIDFSKKRNQYIVLDGAIDEPDYKERDIRIRVSNSTDYSIVGIEIYQDNEFKTYTPLWELYLTRNDPNSRYSLQELLKYAEKDSAVKKLKYIRAVLEDLRDKGWYTALSPVALYDSIIVGRKRSYSKTKNDDRRSINGLSGSVDEFDEGQLEEYDHFKELIGHNPNLILYGPPGTGKTYAVQRIIESMEYERNNFFTPFETILADDRVEFITFHQSYSYEEFVEGIRPVFNDVEVEDAEDSNLRYKVADGIVKKLANRAALSQLKEEREDLPTTGIDKNSTVYKISLGKRKNNDSVYQDCIKNNCIAIGWLDDTDLKNANYDSIYNMLVEERGDSEKKPTNDASCIDTFVSYMQKGDIIFVYDGPTTIRDIGVVEGDYYYDKKNVDSYPHRRPVKWIKHLDVPFDILQYNGGVRLTLKTVYPLPRIQLTDIHEILKSVDGGDNDRSRINSTPCYLIIDEINRGNISKIFGELITLIEKDKRDVLRITLPYSRKPFRLPSNIFIIGTMNTADRSIAILDTALRRRFTFCEIEPNPEVIEKSENSMIEDEIDLKKLLEALNKRIQNLYDREHRIGHSYFLELFNYRAFHTTWYYKIIPLLMDYFYNDIGSVSKIITDKFIDLTNSTIRKLEKPEFITAIKGIYGE